ncbi:MAG: DUF4230 domain-containing protein [Bacteroidota bacterium]
MEALLGLFLGAIITYGVLNYIKFQKNKETTNQQSAILLEKIRKVWKLITVEGEFAEIYHYENVKERFLSMVTSKKKAIILINAKAHIGFDLSKIKMEAINEKKVIRLTAFPQPEVLSVETDFKYYDKKDGLFNKFDSTDLTELNIKAKKHILDKIPDSGLLESARTEAIEAVLMMQNIVETIGWTLDYQDLLLSQNEKLQLEKMNTKKLIN